MRFLAAALVLLFVAVSNAEESGLKLNYPEFPPDRVYVYDVFINLTSGVPEMHSQVSKSVIKMELNVFRETHNNHYLWFQHVRVSGSISSVRSSDDHVDLKPNEDLKSRLSEKIKFVYENGKVVSYTLSKRESLESAKIKRAALAQLQMELKKEYLQSSIHGKQIWWPLTYNQTKHSPEGSYNIHYVVTSSPNPEFPKNRDVVNVSRTDALDNIPYPGYKVHSNAEEQGCPAVCKNDHIENRLGAGCPAGWEPYQGPMKKSYVQHHNLRKYKGHLIIESVRSKETHDAHVYDQNMEVAIVFDMNLKKIEKRHVEEPPAGQKTYTELNEWNFEAREEEINKHCKFPTTEEAIQTVRDLLNEITKIIHEGSIDKAKNIGEKLVLLQKALTLLKHKDFENIQKDIVSHEDIPDASEEDKIKRQIWLESLPLVGTSDSISFIVHLIKKNINENDRGDISLWECKTLLEACPMNILKPTGKIIQEMSELLEILHKRNTPGFGMYYSASHIAVARVIRNLCAVNNGIPEAEKDSKANYLQMLLKENDEDYKKSKCPRAIVKEFIQNVAEKLKSTTDRVKRATYIECLSLTGLPEAIRVLLPFVKGHITEVSPSYVDFVRSMTIHALHNLVGKHPKQIKDIVLPIFFNKTEPSKIRTAAFAVFMRSNPTLANLQHVAVDTHEEKFKDVLSFVITSLESFANSTLPCDQLTAQRAREVLHLCKRSDFGKQHAQNNLKTLFDGMRGLGIDHRIEYTPSNESFFPSTIYAALGYSWGAVTDTAYKFAVNAQGFNTYNLWDSGIKAMYMKPAENLPKSKESEIFPEIEMVNRANEFWRFTVYDKLFYSMSYYYMDEQEFQNGDILFLVIRHLKNYFKVERDGEIHGHLVKYWLYSSLQSEAFAQTVKYPIQAEIRNPLLLSLKLKIKHEDNAVSAVVHPSMYQSTLYTNQILNLGDCKHVGVYHEKKMAGTYPVELVVSLTQDKSYSMSYSFPPLPKKVFVYHSEAGTFARNHTLKAYPSSTEKKTIETNKELFEYNCSIPLLGVPNIDCLTLTEKMDKGYEDLPRDGTLLAHKLIRDFLNAGWTRKTTEISRKIDEHSWGPKTKVKVHLSHHEEYVKPKEEEKKTDDSWMKDIDIDDEKKYASEERKVHNNMNQISHKLHKFDIKVEHITKDKVSNVGDVKLVYKTTVDGNVQTLRGNFTLEVHERKIEVSTNAGAIFFNIPNEFQYGDDSYGKQKGIVFGAVRFQGSEEPSFVTIVRLSNELLDKHINKELQRPIDSKNFYPETHEECLRDVQKGNCHSVACMKAIRQRAEFNKLVITFLCPKELPREMKELLHLVDSVIKYNSFNRMTIENTKGRSNTLQVIIWFIDRLTPKPLIDMVISKPEELIKLHKVEAGSIQPMSSLYSVQDTYIQYHTNNTYPATCALTKGYIRTYDLKTIRLLRNKSCSYILTSHCVRHKKFAVIVKIDSEKSESVEVHAYVGKHTVVLKPGKEGKYEIKFDDKHHTVNYMQSIMLHEREEIYAVITKPNVDKASIIEIRCIRAGIVITYNGQNVKTRVHPRYKGELCGLCSEYDGEIVRELRGPNRCLFSHVDDFIASNALGTCYRAKSVHESICSDGGHDHKETNDEEEIDETRRQTEYEPKLRRNTVISRGNQYCFGVIPTRTCEPPAAPKKTVTEKIGFHCLPTSDQSAKKLYAEAKTRILGEIGSKKVDHEEEIQVPETCAY